VTENEDLASGKELAILAVLAYWAGAVKQLILVPWSVSPFCPPYASDGEGWKKAEEQREEPWKLFNNHRIFNSKKHVTQGLVGRAR
jgi:hypothetical protein